MEQGGSGPLQPVGQEGVNVTQLAAALRQQLGMLSVLCSRAGTSLQEVWEQAAHTPDLPPIQQLLAPPGAAAPVQVAGLVEAPALAAPAAALASSPQAGTPAHGAAGLC